MSSGAERRQHTRYELLAQVRVKRGKVDYVLELTNISQSGVLVHLGSLRVPTWVKLQRAVELAVINPETLATVRLHGTIVRLQEVTGSKCFAIVFGDLDSDGRRGLKDLIELAEKPAAPEERTPTPPPLPKQS